MSSKKDTVCFGEHVTIDGYGGKLELLNDEKRVRTCLEDLPAALGMTIIADPVVKHYEGNHDKDPGGWTGIVLIAESHISIHTFPRRGFVTADVYTCKNGLDLDYILDFFTTQFELDGIEHHLLKRGTEYPAKNIV